MIQDTKASATSQQAVGSWEAAGIELNIQGSTAAIIGQLRKDMQQKTSWGGGRVQSFNAYWFVAVCPCHQCTDVHPQS